MFIRRTIPRLEGMITGWTDGWRWYDFLTPEVKRMLWYTVPRRKLFDPSTYTDDDSQENVLASPPVTCTLYHVLPSPIVPFVWIQEMAIDDGWNLPFLGMTMILVLITLVMMSTLYRRLHNNGQWMDMVTGIEVFDLVAMM